MIRFKIQTEEWPQYAKEHNIEDPFMRMRQQTLFITKEINGIKCLKAIPNPDAPPMPTEQEKADYRFEEEKFVIRRLIEKGYYDDIFWDIEHCYQGNKERLLEYVKILRLCEGTGQCNLFCGYYS